MQKKTIYKEPMNPNLFEEELTVQVLSSMGNPLEQLSALVDFEMFRSELEGSHQEGLQIKSWATTIRLRSYVQSHLPPALLWSG